MNTTAITAAAPLVKHKKPTLPRTPAGRALYTIDWFLNGKPVLEKHDLMSTRVSGIFRTDNKVTESGQ